MDTKKNNVLSAICIDTIKHEYKFYAIRIMDQLYSEHAKGLTIRQIYDILDGCPKEAVDNTLEYLRDCLLIEQAHIPEDKFEPRFNLSEYGKYKLTQYYNSDVGYF